MCWTDRRLVKVCGTSDDESERQQEVMLAVGRKVAMVVRYANAALMATPEKAKTVVRVENDIDKDGARRAALEGGGSGTHAFLTRSYRMRQINTIRWTRTRSRSS